MVKIGPTVFAVAGLAVGAFFTIEGILGVMD
jgi:hypothetical protein